MRTEIGSRLKKLRENYGYSQKQVADYLGITQGQMSKVEHGTRGINTVQLDKLCNLYLVNKDYIVDGVGSPEKRRWNICMKTF